MIRQLTENSIAVDAHEDLEEFELTIDGREVVAWDSDGMSGYLAELPIGSWQILGRGNELTEDQWETVVESKVYYDGDPPGLGAVKYYRDYPDDLEESCIFTAAESGQSLLASEDVDPSKVIILVKQ